MTESTTRTVLITGASRGLGLALAQKLALDGWRLIVDARGAEALETARAELSNQTQVTVIPGDVTDKKHRRDLAEAARDIGGLDALEEVYKVNTFAPLALIQSIREELKPGAAILNVTSDAAVEPYPGWGGYGSSKAALEHLSAILAAENPSLRVYWADPGDMRTRMHQEAFPDEDISDRPLPEESVPGLTELLTGRWPSGRYRIGALAEKEVV